MCKSADMYKESQQNYNCKKMEKTQILINKGIHCGIFQKSVKVNELALQEST